MKFYLLLFFSSCFNSCFPQHDRYQSLLDYSYKIQGVNDSSRQLVNAGTGFILNVKGYDFLVTNYHVLTAKDPLTNSKMTILKDTTTSIIVWLRTKNDTSFIRWKLPLYDSVGKLFSVYHADKNRLVDVAVMLLPFTTPPKSLIFTKKYEEIDTATTYTDDLNTTIVGFPDGKFVNGWQPTIKKTKSIIPKIEGNFINPSIFFKDTTGNGMSGSPIYLQKSENASPLLIGINANHPDYDPLNPLIKGGGVFIKYCVELIYKILEQKKVDVDIYYQ